MTATRFTRRSALRAVAIGLAVPFVFRRHLSAAPSETLYHASIGANGQAWSDIGALAASKHLKLVAVADVDLSRTNEVRKRFPDAKIYQDWRELLDKEKHLDSVNVSIPDHMHGSVAMRALHQGLHVYCQKPLTQTLYEARQLTRAAADRPRQVTQMGIQIHSLAEHRTVVALIQGGAIGKVKEVHSWSGKDWGDRAPRPNHHDPVPSGLNWNDWLGVAAERPFIAGYYHPFVWRKRLDFGTGTFGDMGCHILDPVYGSLELTAPTTARSDAGAPGPDGWGLDCRVRYVFPGTKYSTDTLTLHWYDGNQRPPEQVRKLVGPGQVNDQGSIYLGTEGVLYSPYIGMPMLFPRARYRDYKMPRLESLDHYQQFVEACRGNGRASTPFRYAGALTETVLLGGLATRFANTVLEWDAANLRVRNVSEANRLVRRRVRKGWEVEGL